MKNILIVNGHEYYRKSKGNLNSALFQTIRESLHDRFDLQETIVQMGYDSEEEIGKWQRADAVILQTPICWFSIPGLFKHYIDQVYMDNIFFKGSEFYGKGGQFKEKHYMFSVTWNAYENAFNNENDFFEGKSVDEALYHLHKMQEFIGLKPLPTFACYDVVKNPQVEKVQRELRAHLNEVF
ncbi:NAD(P)H-dependent oxidoreductase [Bacillus sp. SJS]|uniref:NAD(P)H-dependent oxidoreductase n=1 Tax=Bacillus sp. SJS TaxID=1423321 RepID=UPI0004DCD322|nr:NAD(P)H-dependent oxidoreductase [Bacillus sp. SJS]KZZ83635.1 flavodoxin [Bacillus sp. SJS]